MALGLALSVHDTHVALSLALSLSLALGPEPRTWPLNLAHGHGTPGT